LLGHLQVPAVETSDLATQKEPHGRPRPAVSFELDRREGLRARGEALQRNEPESEQGERCAIPEATRKVSLLPTETERAPGTISSTCGSGCPPQATRRAASWLR